MKLIYPAYFRKCPNNSYDVNVPDLGIWRHVMTDDIYHVMEQITQEACAILFRLMESGTNIPNATDINGLYTQENNGFLSYIVLDIEEFAKRYNSNAIKKTLTIPSWMNWAAEARNINFSHVLQKALKDELRQHEPPQMPYGSWG